MAVLACDRGGDDVARVDGKIHRLSGAGKHLDPGVVVHLPITHHGCFRASLYQVAALHAADAHPRRIGSARSATYVRNGPGAAHAGVRAPSGLIAGPVE